MSDVKQWLNLGPIGAGILVASETANVAVFYGSGTNPDSERDVALAVAAPNHALIARLLIAKKIRWEPFSSNSGVGELCFDGLRYCTRLDQFGIPELPDNLRHRLMQAESR